MKGKKGLALWLTLLIIAGIIVAVATFGYVAYLSVQPIPLVVEYDGEFDDAFLATKGSFYSDFSEATDCNITSDVLGGSGYTSCVYDTTGNISTNSTEHRLNLVFDIDNDVENLEIEGTLQNTGTGQAKDDVDIKEVEWWTHEASDEAVMLFGSTDFTIDNEDGEFEIETGVLAGDEYVLHILMKTKLVAPTFVEADDIMKIELDLTTDGDVDAARILLEE